MLYRIKECTDDFTYQITDKNGREKTVKLKEKRVVTFNPKLAEKQIFEIKKQVKKAKKLKASQAKKIRIRRQLKVCNFYRGRQKR